MDLFERIGLRKNMCKMASMVFQLHHSLGSTLLEAYTCWMMGEGITY